LPWLGVTSGNIKWQNCGAKIGGKSGKEG